MYLAAEAKAQAKTLSSLGSSLTTESIFISGYNAAISVIPANKSSQDILCFFKREKNFGRFKTSFNSSRKAGVMQRVKSPFSTAINNSWEGPYQRSAEISTFVSITIFIFFLYDRRGPLSLFLLKIKAFL